MQRSWSKVMVSKHLVKVQSSDFRRDTVSENDIKSLGNTTLPISFLDTQYQSQIWTKCLWLLRQGAAVSTYIQMSFGKSVSQSAI